MKSSPLSNRCTVNPSEASKRPVDLRTRGSSSTRQTISEEGSSVGVMRICTSALFSIWDVVIMVYIRPDSSVGYWTLVLCGIADRRDVGALRDATQLGHGGDTELLHDAAAMNFDRLFRRVQFRRNLFVQQAYSHEAKNFELTGRQFIDTSTRFPSFLESAQLFLSTFQSTLGRYDQFLVVKRL